MTNMFKTNETSEQAETSSLSKTITHSITRTNSSKTQSNAPTTYTLTKTMASSIAKVVIASRAVGPSASNDSHHTIQGSTYKTADTLSSTSGRDSRSRPLGSPETTEDAGSDSTDSTADDRNTSEVKFISTHSRMKRSPIPPKRFASLVTNMKCRRNLTRLNGNSDHGKSPPKIKRVKIVLSKEECLSYFKLPTNKAGKVITSPLQHKEPVCKEAPLQQKELVHKELKDENSLEDSFLKSSLSSAVCSSSDEDYNPSIELDDNCIAARKKSKRKVAQVRYVSFFEDRRYQQILQNHSRKKHTSVETSDRIDTASRTCKKRKSAPPVRYAPFAKSKHQNDPRDKSDSESVISESVTSSIISNPPLTNLHT